DLTFSLGELWTGDGELAGIAGSVEYRTDVFDASSIDLLTRRLQRLLTALTAEPERSLSSVDLIDAPERARLDLLGNRAVLTDRASGASIPELFARQVIRTPEAVARTCEGR